MGKALFKTIGLRACVVMVCLKLLESTFGGAPCRRNPRNLPKSAGAVSDSLKSFCEQLEEAASLRGFGCWRNLGLCLSTDLLLVWPQMVFVFGLVN